MLPLDANFLENLASSLASFMPETALLITFVVAILADLIFKKSKSIAGIISLLGFIIAGVFLVTNEFNMVLAEAITASNFNGESIFSGTFVVDPFSIGFKMVILLSSFIVILMSLFSKELYSDDRSLGEYYNLITGMTFGMFLLAGSNNLIMIYLAIETMSLASYVLAGYTKEIKRASEASLKYVIFGALSSGIMIYGISLLFGLTGSFNLLEINQYIVLNGVSDTALIISVLMILAGFGYKISAVPFHFWAPDVYEGAPVTITAYLSVASKAAGFAVLIRFIKAGFIDPMFVNEPMWEVFPVDLQMQDVIVALSIATMTLGNLVAVWQTNVKRMLAYSSIAHAGYLLMGVAVMSDAGVAAILIYFFAYMLMNLGAFYVVLLIANKTGSEELEDYTGLGYKAPFLGVGMTIFMISLTGLPPTVGFIGKLYLFMSVIEGGFIWLAVIGVLNSVVSLFYYVKVIRNMWVRGVDDDAEKFDYSAASKFVMYLLAFPTLLFGLYYTPLQSWAVNSVKIFLGY